MTARQTPDRSDPPIAMGAPGSVVADAAALFYKAFRASSDLMALTAMKDGRHYDVNRAWLTTLGYRRAEVIGQTAAELGVWADPIDRVAIVERIKATGHVRNFEARLRCKTGETRLCLISVERLDDPDETLLLFSARDVTERRAAEQALRDSERRHRIAIRQAKLAFWRWSFAEQRLTEWSEGYEIVGATGRGVPQDYDAMLAGMHPDDRARVLAVYEEADAIPGPFEVEYRVVDTDGSIRHVREYAEVEYDADGRPVAHVGILQDISDLTHARDDLRRARDELEERVAARTAALERNERYLRAVLENVLDGVVLIDETGTIRDANPTALAMFGYGLETLVGENVAVLMPEPDSGRHDGYIRRYLDSEEPRIIGIGREVQSRRRDGTVFAMSLAVGEMRIGDERMFVGTMRDITAFKEAERSLTRARDAAELANRAKSVFLANMSHELRTPLNAVIGFAETMESEVFGPLGDPHYREYAADIRQSGQHLLDVINDVLDVSAIEAGKLVLNTETVTVADVAAAAVRLVRPRAAEKGVALTDGTGGSRVTVEADGRRLKQVFLNLLSNAVKFTPAGGEVRIEAAADEAGTTVRVYDTGVGMTAREIARALRPFEQVGSGHQEGTGLGLPLARGLVEAHGGRLALDSTPGKGTIVTVFLPAARA